MSGCTTTWHLVDRVPTKSPTGGPAEHVQANVPQSVVTEVAPGITKSSALDRGMGKTSLSWFPQPNIAGDRLSVDIHRFHLISNNTRPFSKGNIYPIVTIRALCDWQY